MMDKRKEALIEYALNPVGKADGDLKTKELIEIALETLQQPDTKDLILQNGLLNNHNSKLMKERDKLKVMCEKMVIILDSTDKVAVTIKQQIKKERFVEPILLCRDISEVMQKTLTEYQAMKGE